MKKIALIAAALLTIAALPGCVYHPGCADPCGGGQNCSIEIIRGGPLDPCAYLGCPLLPWNWFCHDYGYGHGYGGGCGIGHGGACATGCCGAGPAYGGMASGPWMSDGCCDAPIVAPYAGGFDSGCGPGGCGVPGPATPTFAPMGYPGMAPAGPAQIPHLAPQAQPQPMIPVPQQMPPAVPIEGGQTMYFAPGYVTPAAYAAPAMAPAATAPAMFNPPANAQFIRPR